MTEQLPPATPENGSDQQALANKKNRKVNDVLKKKPRLKPAEWAAFGTDSAIVFWQWSEFVGCHDVSKIIFLIFTLLITHAVACYYIAKLLRGVIVARILWVLLSLTVFVVGYKNSKPTQVLPAEKPFPKFRIVLHPTDSPVDDVELTNDFLTPKFPEFSTNFPGCLIVPAKSFEQLPTLRFSVVNDTDEESEPAKVIVTMDKGFDFGTDGLWEWSDAIPRYTNNLWSLSYKLEPLFKLNGQFLPNLTVKPSLLVSNGAAGRFIIQIMPKDRRDSFWMFWLLVSTNYGKARVIHTANNSLTGFGIRVDNP